MRGLPGAVKGGWGWRGQSGVERCPSRRGETPEPDGGGTVGAVPHEAHAEVGMGQGAECGDQQSERMGARLNWAMTLVQAGQGDFSGPMTSS